MKLCVLGFSYVYHCFYDLYVILRQVVCRRPRMDLPSCGWRWNWRAPSRRARCCQLSARICARAAWLESCAHIARRIDGSVVFVPCVRALACADARVQSHNVNYACQVQPADGGVWLAARCQVPEPPPFRLPAAWTTGESFGVFSHAAEKTMQCATP